MTKNNSSNNDNLIADDLANHGVKDIIPENEEYYTLDLKRNFDGDEDDEDELAGFDVANIDPHNLDEIEGPPKSSSIYDNATLVHANGDYHQQSGNQVGLIRNNRIHDQDSTKVGNPGHWGVDEDTG